MKRRLMFFTVVTILMMLLSVTTLAQETPQCEVEYTVQAGDWLSKVAEKYLGDPLAFDTIVNANNASPGDAYTNIDNPDLIEPGWLLCVTGATEETMPKVSDQMESGSQPVELAGTSWRLVSVNGADVTPTVNVTAKFGEDGRVSGSSGCNNYNGSYQVEGNSLTFGPIVGTMMACPEPTMQVESAYLAALGATTTYEIAGDTLLLKDASGNVMATFTAAMPVSLAGSSWLVRGYNNGNQAVVSVIIGTEMTATFGADGTITGSSGCNSYSAAYQADGNNISVEPNVAATMMACPDDVMTQEQQYLAALQTAATYTIEGGRLQMRTTADALAVDYVAAVTGQVTYLQRSALPEDAVLKVQLQDVSLADAPATILGEFIMPTQGKQVPLPFEVTYDPSQIQEGHTYSLSVRIEDGAGKLLFINAQSYPVITRGNPVFGVEVMVDPV